ncbi:hypothetical protein IDJ75_10635 [Mucilaginibacter rigui]|uniref:Transposase n=1 Tax=Mucilaginibacter rigui TaxID=534635 RepID=A0ABR7X599_9SPHI|nr:hypothetical protein [Mucilaginibacter rigui]MBD1385735.1 hypothetical protein [Mucilaginibacter rigui]
MIRGSQTLTVIFTDEEPKTRKVNGALLDDRDMAMAYRFYYHFNIIRRRFDDVPDILEKEFYISATTVVKKLTENSDMLKDIKDNSPGREQLKQMYPHFNWSEKMQ